MTRAAGVLGLVVVLLCIWTLSSTNQIHSQTQQATASSMLVGADEGETPRPSAEQENVLKKRRMQLDRVLRTDAKDRAIALVHVASVRLVDNSDNQRMETTAQRANQRLWLACELRLSDPAIRLHPGHAPPDYLANAAS